MTKFTKLNNLTLDSKNQTLVDKFCDDIVFLENPIANESIEDLEKISSYYSKIETLSQKYEKLKKSKKQYMDYIKKGRERIESLKQEIMASNRLTMHGVDKDEIMGDDLDNIYEHGDMDIEEAKMLLNLDNFEDVENEEANLEMGFANIVDNLGSFGAGKLNSKEKLGS